MGNFNAYITADGSLGLYNKDYDDIYHSAEGALSESLEKFILPVDYDNLLKNDNINVLDICYGIGYNTKSFLSYLFQNKKKFLKMKEKIFSNFTTYSDTIYTDNKLSQKNKNNTDTIYTDNANTHIKKNNNDIYNESVYSDKLFNNIYIKAVDSDEILPFLSPLLKTKFNNKNSEQELSDEKYSKYLSKNIKQKFKINDIVNFAILAQICSKCPDNANNAVLNNAIIEHKKYISSKMKRVFDLLSYKRDTGSHFKGFLSNLHNIYYRYISNRYKKALEQSKIGNIIFDIKIEDARKTVKEENKLYNLIFLDAFSPAKCPCLWSYDFFKELFRILSDDGQLLTYTTSASVKSALVEAGFTVGYIYNKEKNKVVGTIAVKNPSLIEHPLSAFDLGLLKTRAGIFYRDENLTGQNEAIIEAHKFEVLNSERISSTCYIKNNKKESICTT